MQRQPTGAAAAAPAPAEDGLLAALFDRVTHGHTPEEHVLARTLGYDGYLSQPLAVVRELRMAAVHRAVSSNRQLHERAVELWTDHVVARSRRPGRRRPGRG